MSGLMLGVVTLRTADVASLSGYSVQQVRQLESRGVIPAAAREDNGYRRYSGVHVSALSAYRDLAFAIGPVAARSVMTELPRLDPKEAIALLTSTVTEVDELRRQVVGVPLYLFIGPERGLVAGPGMAWFPCHSWSGGCCRQESRTRVDC
jgi:DNA-binding transcriptional MerR regulator